MKKVAIWMMGVALTVGACSESKEVDITQETETYDFTAILEDYVDNTVIPTYAAMKDNASLLVEATQDFQSSALQTDVDKACEYWKATRKPWECSESFLFGPAANKSLDPLLDSWPLDQAQLDQVLAGSQELTADYVRDALGAVLRGFHTIEYLLFRDGSPRDVSDFSEREVAYLVAVSEVLRDDCITLWASWAGVEDGSVEAGILEEIGVELEEPFGDELKIAGNAGSKYLSQTDAIDEIMQGMIGIADEVANAKIADPVTSGDVLDVESWFSWNSLTDFKNNIHSIENSYLSIYDGSTSGNSISDYIASVDADLDLQVKALIESAISALDDIPEPFRNNLNNTEKVNAAIDAINQLRDLLEDEVVPVLFD